MRVVCAGTILSTSAALGAAHGPCRRRARVRACRRARKQRRRRGFFAPFLKLTPGGGSIINLTSIEAHRAAPE